MKARLSGMKKMVGISLMVTKPSLRSCRRKLILTKPGLPRITYNHRVESCREAVE